MERLSSLTLLFTLFVAFLIAQTSCTSLQVMAQDVSNPPTNHPLYPGTGEDFIIETGSNAAPTAFPDVKLARSDDSLTIRLDSPDGSFYGNPFVLGAQVFGFGDGVPSVSGPLAGALHLNSGAVMLVGRSGLLIEPLLPNGGFSVTVRIPAFLFRMNIICQGLLVPTPERPVANGILALTDGHVIQVL